MVVLVGVVSCIATILIMLFVDANVNDVVAGAMCAPEEFAEEVEVAKLFFFPAIFHIKFYMKVLNERVRDGVCIITNQYLQ